jgi:hypothetical protein
MTPMRARRDESIWSTDAAIGLCRAVKPKADAADRRVQPLQVGQTQRVGPYFKLWRWFWGAW